MSDSSLTTARTTTARTTTVAATAAPVTARRTPSRRTHLTVRVLQIVLALFYVGASAAPKLAALPAAVESFDTIGFGHWFMYAVGVLELAGGIALVVPLLSGVSALALIGLMIGAFVVQLTSFDGENALTPLLLILPLALIARVRRNETARLVALVRARL
ncbi:DoxX family protein [Streptomyces sp. NBC_00370]|uniref:DoxX family protein n=1 Tax=Streptomyces sp. NBC_00370 TaxID=2975728 RepID=UPI002E255B10